MLRYIWLPIAILSLLTTAIEAADWPTYRGDLRRSGMTRDTIDARRLRPAWTFRSSQPPIPAWGGPAKWDAYAGLRGLRNMRDYDRCFPVAVGGNAVYFGSSVDHCLRCLDRGTGRLRWRFTTDGPIRVCPTLYDGRIYFGSDDGFAYCLNAAYGKLIWKLRAPVEEPLILNNGRFISKWPCRSGVAVKDGIAYAAFSLLPWQPSWLCAVDAKTGKPVGKGRFIRKLTGKTLEGTILVDRDRLMLTQGRIEPYLFERATGKPIGSLKNGGGSFVSTNPEGLMFHGPGNKTGWLIVSDPKTRKPKWTLHGKVGVVVTGELRILRSDKLITTLNRTNGKFVWKRAFEFTFDHIVAGETVFVAIPGEVVALSLNDGRTIWRGKVDGSPLSLAVANGSLFASTESGAIQCFAPGTQRYVIPPAVARRPFRPPLRRAVGIEQAKHPALRHRWVFYAGMNERARRRGVKDAERRVPDQTGNLPGRMLGDVRLSAVGGVEALQLDGKTTSVRIADDHSQLKLPTKTITAEAWVRIDAPTKWGGIQGAIQDNGKDEHGWLLGYTNDRFSFAIAARSGNKAMTYLAARTPFDRRRWYHVAGTYDGKTQRLYINGRLANESTSQHGDIDYPKQAFFELGAYHDKDEYFRLQGMIHDVRLYDQALTADEIQRNYKSGIARFPRTTKLAAGPWVRFRDPRTTVVRWETRQPTATRLTLSGADGERVYKNVKSTRRHAVILNGLKPNREYRYVIETRFGKRVGRSPAFELETDFNYSPPTVSQDVRVSNAIRTHAQQILSRSGVQRGICLVDGCGDGRLLYELAKQSALRIVAIDSDVKQVAAARRFLLNAGVYGSRVTVRNVVSRSKLPFGDRFANLVVTLRIKNGDLDSLVKQTAPGGVAMIHHSTAIQINKRPHPSKDGWVIIRQPRKKGAGEWSHLYGRPDNSAFGGETLAGSKSIGDLRLKWIGLPGPRAQADRNGRKPSPLAKNGRLFVQGLHRIAALDAHNGSVLWSLEIPEFERFNMPRDCGNWCVDDDYLYAVVRNRCWQIDAKTGRVVKQHMLESPSVKSPPMEWGYVARVGNKLLGSAVKQGTSYRNFWGKGDAGWYDAIKGAITRKVCSERLFAADRKSGERDWTYSKGVILNSTITATQKRIWFLECRNPKVIAASSRRIGGAELWKQMYLVALNTETGRTIWERAVERKNDSIAVYLAYGEGRLVLTTTSGGRYEVQAFNAGDGKPNWKQQFGWPGGKHDHGKAISRPAIAGGKVFVRPKAIDLRTGKLLKQLVPVGGCGTYACTAKSLIYRSGSGGKMTVWDINGGKTTAWNRLRPGCWLSTIPACGMLLSPEAGGGCSCGKWIEASMGFAPRSLSTK